MTEKVKIGFSMIHYPVAMGRYMWEALLRRDDVEVWATGPFSGRSIPWKGGMTLPENYVRTPELPLAMGAPLNYGAISVHLPWEPDLWIEVNGGLVTHGRPDCPYTVIGSDPHVLDYSTARAKADQFFCMQQPYMQPNDSWLPYAYDPIHHTPSPVKWEKRYYHCSLVGLMYDNRREFFNTLKRMGRNIYLDTGLAYQDAKDIYHNTMVGFNWASLQDTTARVFELMAMGVVPLLNRVPDLQQLFKEDESYLGFSTMGEALEKFNWAMDHPDECQKIIVGALKAVKEHTWDARMETVLISAGLGQIDG